MFKIICDHKHEHFTKKIDNQLIAGGHETTSRVNDKLVLPWYSKSKGHNVLTFCGRKLWNTNRNDTISNVLSEFSDNADWWVQMLLTHYYIKNSQLKSWSSFYVSFFKLLNFPACYYFKCFNLNLNYFVKKSSKQVGYLKKLISYKYYCATKSKN